MTTNTKSVFHWRTGEATAFASDPAHNGTNIEIGRRARAAKEAKPVVSSDSINTETQTEQGKRFRLRRRSQ